MQKAWKTTHPGVILKMELEARGIKRSAFARQLGMRISDLDMILKGKERMTKEFADKVEELKSDISQ